MKTKLTFMFVLLLGLNIVQIEQAQAQSKDDVEEVRDDITRETFITFHKRQLENFELMREHEGNIVATQTLVKNEAQEIARIRGEIYSSLSRVSNLIMDIRSVVAIAEDTQKTFEYIADCERITYEHPQLAIIAMETKVAIYNRISQLNLYLTTALTGGEMNLMNNADRIKFISRVSTDMRVLKGYTFYLRSQLELAIENGFWRSLFPGLFVWEDLMEYKVRTSARIISEFNL